MLPLNNNGELKAPTNNANPIFANSIASVMAHWMAAQNGEAMPMWQRYLTLMQQQQQASMLSMMRIASSQQARQSDKRSPSVKKVPTNSESTSDLVEASTGDVECTEPKPTQSYIGLIAMAILSSEEKKMVLADIYSYILTNYPYFQHRGPGWRNSIRHNLSLNDCFVKAGRSANGKGHFWGIHPANMDDFMKGDFRRRRAQRKVRRAMGLAVDDDSDSDNESTMRGTMRQSTPMLTPQLWPIMSSHSSWAAALMNLAQPKSLPAQKRGTFLVADLLGSHNESNDDKQTIDDEHPHEKYIKNEPTDDDEAPKIDVAQRLWMNRLSQWQQSVVPTPTSTQTVRKATDGSLDLSPQSSNTEQSSVLSGGERGDTDRHRIDTRKQWEETFAKIMARSVQNKNKTQI